MLHVRLVAAADLDAITDIHGYYAAMTHVSFDQAAYTRERREQWFTSLASTGPYQAYVAEADGIVGYAQSGPWRPKAAYARSVETTVLVRPGHGGRGIGSALYRRLLDELAGAGVHRAYAVIALPNAASVRFHERFGFEVIGDLDDVGWKNGTWVATRLMQLRFEDLDPGDG